MIWGLNRWTYFVSVAHTKSAGTVAGRDRACNNLAPLCRNIQFARPLLADSMYVWNTCNTVSGISPINASCERKKSRTSLIWRFCRFQIHSEFGCVFNGIIASIRGWNYLSMLLAFCALWIVFFLRFWYRFLYDKCRLHGQASCAAD